MRSVNKVILIGNLTRNPELKSTASGQSIVTFGLATNRQWTTSNGEKRSSAEFHECVAWAKLAEICNDHLNKGMLVYVEGYLKTRTWDMEDGTRRFKTEVVLHDMIILEKRGDRKNIDYAPNDGIDADVDEDYEGSKDFGPEEKTEKKSEEHKNANKKENDQKAEESEVSGGDTGVSEGDQATGEEKKKDAGELKADIDDDDMF